MRRLAPVPLTTRPRVSVVVPCYNYGHFLPEAVASALDQRDVDVDVLIVDDCSTDDSATVAQRLAAADPRVDVLLHETNRGHIQTYNDGLAKVTGDYVVLLSADDMLTKDSLTRAVALMDCHPNVGLVYGWAQSFADQPPQHVARTRNWSVWAGHEWLRLAAKTGRCFLSSPEALMRRDALTQTEGYDPRLPHSGDFDMWLRTAVRWDIGRVNGPAQAFYRVHANNMHLTTYDGWLTDLAARRLTFDILFDERILPGDAALRRMRALARRALAREALRRGVRMQRDAVDRAHGGDEFAAFRAFAVETDPAIERTWWWRVAERRSAVEAPAGALGARRFTSRVRDHLEWRHRRRYGT
jgi:glycosyltransferase involved in cell wall biosynthesis